MAKTPPPLRFKKTGVYSGLRKIAPPILYKAMGTRILDDTRVAQINFRDSDGKQLKEQFDLADFQPRNCHKVVDRLANRGYQWPSDVKAAYLVSELIKTVPTRQFRLVNAPGWHEETYVTAHWCATRPGQRQPRFRLDPDSGAHIAAFSLNGSLKAWKETVAEVAQKSASLRLFIAAAFTAPLLRHLNVDSFGLNLFGRTSSGKTTCEFAAASVPGIIHERSLPGWADSEPALEQLAVGHRDGVLPLDDTSDGQMSIEKKAKSIAFAIARNRPRMLDKRYQTAGNITTREYRVIILSSSETSLGDIARDAGKQRGGGEEVRLIDIPCMGRQGIFDEETDAEQARKIIDLLKINSEVNQGVALRRFLRRFQQDGKALSKLERNIELFESSTTVDATDTANLRMRKYFAAIFAASALAIEYDVLPWKKRATLRAISLCMNNACNTKAVGKREPSTTATIGNLAQNFKSEIGKLSLVPVAKRKRLRSADDRLWEQADGFNLGSEIYVKPKRWNAITENNREELVRLKILKVEKRGDTCTVARKLKGLPKKQRYHVIDMTVLNSLALTDR